MVPVARRKVRVAEAATAKRKSDGRTARSNAARKLASVIENHMNELGLSEQQKNERVSTFTNRVNGALGRPAKS